MYWAATPSLWPRHPSRSLSKRNPRAWAFQWKMAVTTQLLGSPAAMQTYNHEDEIFQHLRRQIYRRHKNHDFLISDEIREWFSYHIYVSALSSAFCIICILDRTYEHGQLMTMNSCLECCANTQNGWCWCSYNNRWWMAFIKIRRNSEGWRSRQSRWSTTRSSRRISIRFNQNDSRRLYLHTSRENNWSPT